MLSILIPTYNYDCTCLVSDLQQQAEQVGIDYEIIVADDASPILSYKEINRTINAIPHCRLIELEENLGRARIRNYLADEAQHTWLLFMDADAEVISQTFIADYLALTEQGIEVVCGGLCHADTLPTPEVSLRYAYEKRADKRRAAYYREKRPYEQFTPFNFLINRNTFQSIRFNEHITEYGHEDTLFGITLEEKGISIRHIDNPLLHTGLEKNELFLSKTRVALRNLSAMEARMQGHSSLLKLHNLLHGVGLDYCMARWFARKEQVLTKRLTEKRPSVYLFFIYKLGYYCQIKQS